MIARGVKTMQPTFWMDALEGGWDANAPVFRGLDLKMGSGQVTLLRGENGSGKTSVLLAVLGLLPYVRGRVGHAGGELRGPTWRRVRALGAGVAMQRLKVFPSLTARENIEQACGRARARRVVERYDLFRPLDAIWNHVHPARYLSGGEQCLVNLASAIGGMAPVGLLCLDEPLANLHSDLHGAFKNLLAELLEGGASALICEHHGGPAERLVDADFVLDLSGAGPEQ